MLDPEVVDLVARVARESKDFRRLWERKDLAAFAPAGRAVYHPRLGKAEFEYIKMHAADDDKTLVAFIAQADSELSRGLAALIDAA